MLYAQPQSLQLAEPSFVHLPGKVGNIETNKVFQDNLGFIWFATNQGLFRFDGSEFRHFNGNNSGLSNNMVMDIAQDFSGHLWLSTYGGGLNRFDPTTEQFIHFVHQDNAESLSIDTLWDIELGSDGQLWVGSRNWLNRMDTQTLNIERFGPQQDTGLDINNNVWSVLQGKQHTLWIGTLGGGLYRYETDTKLLSQFQHNSNAPSSLSQNLVRTIAEDHNGQIWIGTDHGLNVLNPDTGQIKRYFHNENDGQSLSSNEINRIFCDRSGRIWIGTYGAGLNLYQPNSDNFRRFNFNSLKLEPSQIGQIIKDIFEDRQGNLWIASNKGVLRLDPTALNLHRLTLQQLDNEVSFLLNHMSNDTSWAAFGQSLVQYDRTNFAILQRIVLPGKVTSIAQHNAAEIWLAVIDHGLLRYNIVSKNLTAFNQTTDIPLSFQNIATLHLQAKNRLWLGLYRDGNPGGLLLFDPKSGDKKHFFADRSIVDIVALNAEQLLLATNSHGIILFNQKNFEYRYIKSETQSLNQLVAIHRSDNDKIWLATQGGGIAELLIKDNLIKHLAETIGEVNWVWQLNNGQIWYGSENTLFNFQPQTQELKSYGPEQGINVGRFSNRAVMAVNGHLWLGTDRGLVQFNPADTSLTTAQTAPVFSDLRVFNQPAKIASNSDHAILTKAIQFTDNIEFTYTDYLFSVGFTPLDFRSPQSLKFAYQLDGFDSRWIETDASSRTVSYSNLPAGQYQLRVKSIDQYGQTLSPPNTMTITILPPWWKTQYAYLAYVVLSILSVLGIVESRTRILSKRTHSLEQGITQRTAELAQKNATIATLLAQKRKLFTDISHELRTPLSLILSPLEQLLEGQKNHSQKVDLFNTIKRNAQRLQHLVEQMLQLANLENNPAPSQQVYPLQQSLTAIVAAFKAIAAANGQTLTLNCDEDSALAMQSDGFEIIFGNLIGNAIKYSAAGNTIEVLAKIKGNSVSISVKDNGCGIDHAMQSVIFERFNRGSFSNSEQVPGSGIGLSLVKALVEKHQGNIALYSEPNVGSQFIVTLPLSEAQDPDMQSQPPTVLASQWFESKVTHTNQTQCNDNITYDDNLPQLLIIEDNDDLRWHLVSLLSAQYRCQQTDNGTSGLAIARQQVPDIIVSDVNMPQMDGFEFSRHLRQDPLISHIPIILLTARADQHSRITGWRNQVDDYICKPFSPEELRTRLDNLLSIRNILRQRFASEMRQNPKALAQTKQALNPKDRQFITRFEQLIGEHYAEPDFQLTEAAAAMAMSDRQLQRKLKAIIAMTFSDYVRHFRLNMALSLLQDAQPINLVVENIGFSSPSYFSSCFKAEFGQTPKQYQQAFIAGNRQVAQQQVPA